MKKKTGIKIKTKDGFDRYNTHNENSRVRMEVVRADGKLSKVKTVKTDDLIEIETIVSTIKISPQGEVVVIPNIK